MLAPHRTRIEARPSTIGRRRLRGGILLELLLSIALFVGAALLVLDAMGGALDGVRRADLRARAMDLAQSRLAELDAGLVAIGDLGDASTDARDGGARGPSDDLVVSIELAPVAGGGDATTARATVRVRVPDSIEEGAIVLVAERVVTMRERREARGGGR